MVKANKRVKYWEGGDTGGREKETAKDEC